MTAAWVSSKIEYVLVRRVKFQGFPPREDTNQLGTPRDQWERGLTAEEWYAYTGVVRVKPLNETPGL